MKERPILFTGPLVLKLLSGEKTVTRRPVRLSALEWCGGNEFAVIRRCADGHDGPGFYVHSEEYPDEGSVRLSCPYGEPGDRLWVKETHLLRGMGEHVVYRADMDPVEAAGFGAMYGGWRPSIFTRRKHSRLLLDVAGVGVQRLKSISCDEIRDEGVGCPLHDFPGGFCHGECAALREHFYGGWDALYSQKPDLQSSSNPWVWVVHCPRAGIET